MKKVLNVVFACFLALNVWAERVSPEDAATVANNFMNVASTSSSAKKAPAKKQMVLKTSSAPQAEEPQYYIYENANGEGWVMVAANDVVRPILAYSETGYFRMDNMPKNITRWLGKYNNFIKKLESDGVTAGEETTAEWRALRKGVRKAKGDAVVGPLVQTQWDQDAPYNDLCPGSGSSKAYTGCVATAMAQVMNYWQWPVQGTGSRTYQPKDPNSNTGANSKRYGQQTANFGNTTYDWANMKKKHYTSDTQAQKTAISTLMYHCGVATDMMYGNSADGGSGTYTVNYGDWDWSDSEGECAQNALYMFFGYKKATGYMRSGYTYSGYKYYDKWTDDAWTAMVKAELDKLRPIMYAGAGNEGGHSFICDGYDDAGYFHFNWGWSGSNDGYYTLAKLAPGSGGAGGGGYDFSEDQDVIIGIEPNIAGHTVVTNGTGCSISCASVIENNKALTATITPTDATYDFTSLSVKLGTSTLSENTHYTLSEDKKTLTIKATAITGDASNNLTITAVWTKNRCSYSLLGENCTPEEVEGELVMNAALNLTITPSMGYTLANAACWEVEMGGTMLTYGSGFTYNASNGAFSIANVTGDVVILASAGKETTWKANGTTFATTMTSNDKYVLPTSIPEIECDGKVFVGWCATADYSSETTAPTFIKDGDAANKGSVLYAVFAEQSGSGSASNTTYTFTSKSWDDATGSWSSQKDGNDYTADQGVQVTSGTSGAGANTTKSFSNVSTVVVNYCTNAKKGAGSVQVTIGDVAKSQDVTVSGGTSLRDLEYTFENASGTAAIEVTCGTNSIYINAITITTSGGTSYSNYSTSCTPPCVGELTGITLNTTNVQKEFTEGDAFTYEGLVVTANYDGCDSKTVTPTSVSSPNMNTIGKQTVTVNYQGQTATYEITIIALPTYTIRFYNNTTLLSSQNVKQGQAAQKPVNPTACEGYTFVGWWTAVLNEDNAEAKSWVTDFTATKDQDYYAVFTYTEDGGTALSNNYKKIINKADLTDGNYLIVAQNSGYNAMSTTWKDTYYLAGKTVTPSSDIITTTDASIIWELAVSDNMVSIHNASAGYLYIVKSSTYYNIKLGDNTTANKFTYSVTDGNWLFTSTTYTDRVLEYYTAQTRWAYYTSADAPVYLYKQQEEEISIIYYTTQPDCTECTNKVTLTKGTPLYGSFSLDKADGAYDNCKNAGFVVTVSDITPAEDYQFKEITQTGINEGVAINQEAKTVTYAKNVTGSSTINVVFEHKPVYTISFYDKGTKINEQEVTEGKSATKPSNPTGCEGYTFVGWWGADLDADNTETKSWVEDFTATQDTAYYAIYSHTEEAATGGTVVFDFESIATANNWNHDSNHPDVVISPVSIHVDKGSSNYQGRWWNTDKIWRIYAANSLTITCSDGDITAVTSDPSKTFFINGNEASLSAAANFKSISITYGALPATYYSSVACGSATDIENTNANANAGAVKQLRNGQIVIVRGDAVYSITGIRIE